ncbi:hypothetical protein PLICRDRAFT_330286 [Plicaturopsis crispa FD-325 SS-3]|uniref:Unplaced genomic scaffold PLICRscaffold_15, whole genome shotgun sequence n=1 Tax=Plicaturopsis crispa FD-325 SS-3 TaxID=944288 RepID=A0A0C9SYH6_PLICR|nr:hypothetical protein PLICRDRAFT_330286 [Plicaturopsis crispa FD-325 SS-3]
MRRYRAVLSCERVCASVSGPLSLSIRVRIMAHRSCHLLRLCLLLRAPDASSTACSLAVTLSSRTPAVLRWLPHACRVEPPALSNVLSRFRSFPTSVLRLDLRCQWSCIPWTRVYPGRVYPGRACIPWTTRVHTLRWSRVCTLDADDHCRRCAFPTCSRVAFPSHSRVAALCLLVLSTAGRVLVLSTAGRVLPPSPRVTLPPPSPSVRTGRPFSMQNDDITDGMCRPDLVVL